VFYHCQGNNVFRGLLPNNGCYAVACFHNCYLAMGLHVTIYIKSVTGELVLAETLLS
jgi:hypothetical protein